MRIRRAPETGGQGRKGRRAARPAGFRPPRRAAFTLMEVLIAGWILFMCLFAILVLVTNSLRNARALQLKRLDPGMAAAQLYVDFTTTNRVSEGSGSGDFGDDFPEYQYDWNLTEVATNGLCELDITIHGPSSLRADESRLSLLLYLPNLQNGSMSGRFPR
jgi:Tfp pilus assembly protein PilV